MRKVLYIAPFVTLRYKGGMMKIAESLGCDNAKALLQKSNIELEFFNSHFLTQSKNSQGKLRIENIRQAFTYYRRLKKRLKDKNFEIIHVNSSTGIPLLRDLIIINILRNKTSKPIVFQIHFCGIKETFIFPRFSIKLYFFLFSKLDTLVLLSHSFKNELISHGFPANKIVVIPNFHQFENFSVSCKSHNLNKLSLLFIGSIGERKGVFDLLEALNGIRIEYELIVAGSFESQRIEKRYNKIVRSNNLNVRSIGYVNSTEKIDILKNADILILPSYAEGFPMVIPEAMAFGCAIISTRIAGIPEIVEENVNGFLIEPGQVTKLKFYLEYLFLNHEILQSFKASSIAISDKFNLTTFIDKLTSIYFYTDTFH